MFEWIKRISLNDKQLQYFIKDEDIRVIDNELRKFFEENFSDVQYVGCMRCDLDKVCVFFKTDRSAYKKMKEIISKMQEKKFEWLDVIILIPYLGGGG